MGLVATAEGIAYHARQVREASITRATRRALSKGLESAAEGGDLLAECSAELARIRLPDVATGELAGATLFSALQRVEAAQGGKISGIRTGIHELDRMTMGFPFSLVSLIAGRPQLGKSALALQIALSAAGDGAAVDYYSLEDDRVMTMQRAIAQVSGIDLRKLIGGGLCGEEFAAAEAAAAKLHRLVGAALWINDEIPRDSEGFAMEVERSALARGAKLIVIDYVQLLRDPGYHAKNRNDELSLISNRLKGVAKATGAAVLVLSQLNREADKDDEPQLFHLRDCGALEADAHVVLMLGKPKWLAYEHDDEPLPITMLYQRKNKNCGPGSIGLAWNGPAVRFGSLDRRLAEEMSAACARRRRGGKR